jgi:hypothetical protein
MATREQVHKLVDELPDAALDPVVEFIVSRRANGTDETVDEWGNLDAWSDAAGKDTMRMLDDEESAIGFSWEQRDPA